MTYNRSRCPRDSRRSRSRTQLTRGTETVRLHRPSLRWRRARLRTLGTGNSQSLTWNCTNSSNTAQPHPSHFASGRRSCWTARAIISDRRPVLSPKNSLRTELPGIEAKCAHKVRARPTPDCPESGYRPGSSQNSRPMPAELFTTDDTSTGAASSS